MSRSFMHVVVLPCCCCSPLLMVSYAPLFPPFCSQGKKGRCLETCLFEKQMFLLARSSHTLWYPWQEVYLVAQKVNASGISALWVSEHVLSGAQTLPQTSQVCMSLQLCFLLLVGLDVQREQMLDVI